MNRGVSAAPLPLDLAMAVEPDPGAPAEFVGAGRDYGPLRVYGGHLLGQGLAAGLATVEPDKLAHSLHAYFLKTGDPAQPIRYAVEVLRSGRSYATRAVRATQAESLLLTMMVSFKTPEPGDEHQPAPSTSLGPAEASQQRQALGGEPLALPFSAPFGIELEALDGWHPRAAPGRDPSITMWMRAPMSPNADARSRQCALAYLSDSSLMFNALRPYGRAVDTHRATSLDHSLWFYRAADPGEWLLFEQHSPAAADSRGLNQGHIFDDAGRLVASAAQESMLRRT
jgi:acyl-CoA thioesterase-2